VLNCIAGNTRLQVFINIPFYEIFCPLIAAEATTFFLIKKNQKIKTEKTFCPQGLLPARFSVGPLGSWFNNISCHSERSEESV